MLIVGELINSSRSQIKEAIEKRGDVFIKQLARDQFEAGANYVDVNAGTFYGREPEKLEWLVEVVQQEVNCPLCIDSPNPDALRRALEKHQGEALINSVTAEEKRYKEIVPLVKEYGARVIALTIDESGIPDNREKRIKIAEQLVERLVADGVNEDRIYIDPLVEPLSTKDENGLIALETINYIAGKDWEVHTICGLSNISFGLPGRKFINHAFAAMAVASGLDSAILNPLDKHLLGLLKAGVALTNKDPYCKGYLTAYRKGLFK
ncbi:methyltetrahydrofolate cobalamin methyltransferase [Desulfoscipio geothermicus]|uniref:5-methyltetrahydrofolate--homocysteine methyltransferase n=1 Tax=Desulfoscipio geothermicus DSM 3669 TaxID=1121426 RepID=A0A1I6DEI3_9FIRM|nr:methyltetrahydrofolate cobalamin methyltransferase [Desulfoscipio geothermicus]SFR03900.1 5-methyltetrahydrofolate--homocysteine methyltransferase [Desulfoscipio geothermicus DSM 3669]